MTDNVNKNNAAERAVLNRFISFKVDRVAFDYSNIKLSKAICNILGSADFCGCFEDIEFKEKEYNSQSSTHRKESVIDIFSGISTTALANFSFSSIEITMSETEIRTESIITPSDNMSQTFCPQTQMDQYTNSIKQLLNRCDMLEKENDRLERKCEEEHEKRIIIEAKYDQLCCVFDKFVSTTTIQTGMEDEARYLVGSISSGSVGKKPRNKSDAEFEPTMQTFKIKIDNYVAFNQAICKAFNYAIEYKLISQDSKQDDFLAVFSGKATEARLKWTSTNGALKYFMSKLKKKGIVDIPKGFGIWQVTKSHFVDDKGKTITVNLANEHAPKNAELIANINDIVATLGIDY